MTDATSTSTTSATSSAEVTVSASTLQSYIESILTANSVSAEHARITAEALVLADLRGVDTHGSARIPSYVERIRRGVLNAQATPSLEQITPVAARIDAHNGFGFPAAYLAMSSAIAMARVYGVGMVAVRRSNHFGMSAWVVQQAIDAGMMSLVFTNSSPALPVFGGMEKLLGVSPIACGAPSGARNKSRPFILDMAPSVAARGKIYKALRRGEKIPEDWALDANGKMTTDPAEALKGTMLPMGGPKGSALAIMMDVFSGVFSGAAFAGGVTGPYDPSKEADVGHFIVAIKPDLWMTMDEFEGRMAVLYHKVVGSRKMEGVDRIYFPGEVEQELHEERLRNGIPFKKTEADALSAEGLKVGLEALQVQVQQ